MTALIELEDTTVFSAFIHEISLTELTLQAEGGSRAAEAGGGSKQRPPLPDDAQVMRAP